MTRSLSGRFAHADREWILHGPPAGGAAATAATTRVVAVVGRAGLPDSVVHSKPFPPARRPVAAAWWLTTSCAATGAVPRSCSRYRGALCGTANLRATFAFRHGFATGLVIRYQSAP